MKDKDGINGQKDKSFVVLLQTLRQALDDRFSDILIQSIVDDHFNNETLRLKSSIYKVQSISPNYREFQETIESLNSLHVLLCRLSQRSSFEYKERVDALVKEYEEMLDLIIATPTPYYLFYGDMEDKQGNPIKIIRKRTNPFLRDNYSLPAYTFHVFLDPNLDPLEYPPLVTKYSFYYTSLLALLKEFIEQNPIAPSIGGLSISQHVAVYCLINQNTNQSKGEEQKFQLEYVNTNGITLDDKGLRSLARSIRRYRKEDNWTPIKISNRLALLKSIEGFIESNYRNHLVTLEKEKKFLIDEQTDLE